MVVLGQGSADGGAEDRGGGGDCVKVSKQVLLARLFVCVEVLRPSQPNGIMSSAVNLPKHTFTG